MTTSVVARCDSVSRVHGIRLVSLECTYSAAIHAEVLACKDLSITTYGGNHVGDLQQTKRSLITSSEWANFFATWGSVEYGELQAKVVAALNESTPKVLDEDDWHLPYIDAITLEDIYMYHLDEQAEIPADELLALSERTALKVSVVRCADVSPVGPGGQRLPISSFLFIFDKLVRAGYILPTCTEHQAQPDDSGASTGALFVYPQYHGNLRGWKQFRRSFIGERRITGRYNTSSACPEQVNAAD